MYTIKQAFETKADGGDSEYWIIVSPNGQAVASEKTQGMAELAARMWNQQTAQLRNRNMELEAEIAKMKEAIEGVLYLTNQDVEDGFRIDIPKLVAYRLRLKEALKAEQSPAPQGRIIEINGIENYAMEEDDESEVTLSDAEIANIDDSEAEWLAWHMDSKGLIVRTKLLRIPERYQHLIIFDHDYYGLSKYRLADKYDTTINRQVIKRYMQELGLEA